MSKRKQRDYRAEYLRRLQRGVEKGLTKSHARGHARFIVKANPTQTDLDRARILEKGIKLIGSGYSLSVAAKELHVAPESLRAYAVNSGIVRKKGRRWQIKFPSMIISCDVQEKFWLMLRTVYKSNCNRLATGGRNRDSYRLWQSSSERFYAGLLNVVDDVLILRYHTRHQWKRACLWS